MSWNERTGILSRENGFVTVGFHCVCEAYDVLTLPQDDYNEADMHKELCYTCLLRKRLASEIRHGRKTKRKAVAFIESMEKQLNILMNERQNHDSLLQSGSQIIAKQDEMIRELKQQLQARVKKGSKKTSRR